MSSAVDWQALSSPVPRRLAGDLLIRTCAGTTMTKERLGYKKPRDREDHLRVSVRAKPSFVDLAF